MKVWLWCTLFLCSQTFSQSTVAFFYGKEPPLLQLCMYDKIVVDPYSDFNPEDCAPLSLPIAYLSLGEVAKDAPYQKKIPKAWIIGNNPAWNHNDILDQTNTDWQSYVIHQQIEPLWNKGYRGFFLDTLDSYILAIEDPQLRDQQTAGLVNLIQQIKTKYPSAHIMLNRGFHLLPQLHAQVDAVVIESLYHAWNQRMQRYELTTADDQQQLLQEINTLQHLQLPVIVIDYLKPKDQGQAQALSDQIAQKGLIPWITNKELTAFYIKKINPIKRKILILFSNDDHLSAQFIPALRYVATILEYMGYVPEYINLNEKNPLPTNDLSNHYAGIILWLETENHRNTALLSWVQQQIKYHLPVVFLNGFGVANHSPILADLGLKSPLTQESIHDLHISQIDSTMIGYETPPIKTPYYFYPLKADNSHVLLQLDNEHHQTQDAVAITPWGGYAINPYVIQFLPNYYALWVINPFEFLSQSLKLQDFPVPDTTTENGRRLMSVHIDGDGFTNQAKWIGGRYAAEELRDLVLKQFKIPTSVSVITGEIAPNGIHPKESPQLEQIARSIFALPWVEIASHSFSHPFNWQNKPYNKQDQHTEEPYVFKIPHYRFNLDLEITRSVDYINRYLAPAHKKTRVFFWSGLANPSREAMAIIHQHHLLNINGLSDTDIDKHHPAITGIRPMGMLVGNDYQIFAPIQMDFYYMNQFAGPMYGYRNVIQTFELTDYPRRMKPIDLYYHIYSASYPASLQALITVYRWALKQPVMNIYISDYIQKVMDYYQIKIGQTLDQWRIVSNGDLRELRSARQLGYPDLLHSQNVIGFKDHENDRYIHLGPRRLTVLRYQANQPSEPYLVDANARVEGFSRHDHQLDIHFHGYMPIKFRLANIKHCKISSSSPLTIRQDAPQTKHYSSSEANLDIHITC